MKNDMDFLVEVTELSSACSENSEEVDPSESMYQRCEVVLQRWQPKLRKAAIDKYDYAALMPLFASDFRSLHPFKRPLNTAVSSEFFESTVFRMAEAGYNCFIDRSELGSSLPFRDGVTYKQLEEAIDAGWMLYISLPNRRPPRHYWVRNVVFPIRKVATPLLPILPIIVGLAFLIAILIAMYHAVLVGNIVAALLLMPLMIFLIIFAHVVWNAYTCHLRS